MAAAVAASSQGTPVRKPRKRDVPQEVEDREEGDHAAAAVAATPTPSKKKPKALVMDTSFDMTEELRSKVCTRAHVCLMPLPQTHC